MNIFLMVLRSASAVVLTLVGLALTGGGAYVTYVFMNSRQPAAWHIPLGMGLLLAGLLGSVCGAACLTALIRRIHNIWQFIRQPVPVFAPRSEHRTGRPPY